MFLTLNLVMLKDFLIKNKIRREKIKIKTISGLQAGPTGRRHDTAFVTARVWASPQAQHDPFYYRTVHGPWVGRHEPG
jgi:hypothetical protein